MLLSYCGNALYMRSHPFLSYLRAIFAAFTFSSTVLKADRLIQLHITLCIILSGVLDVYLYDLSSMRSSHSNALAAYCFCTSIVSTPDSISIYAFLSNRKLSLCLSKSCNNPEDFSHSFSNLSSTMEGDNSHSSLKYLDMYFHCCSVFTYPSISETISSRTTCESPWSL